MENLHKTTKRKFPVCLRGLFLVCSILLPTFLKQKYVQSEGKTTHIHLIRCSPLSLRVGFMLRISFISPSM